LPGTVLGGARASDGEHKDGEVVFRHACKLGLEGIVSKRKDSPYRSGRSPDWLKMKNTKAPAVKREAEEDWGRDRWRLEGEPDRPRAIRLLVAYIFLVVALLLVWRLA
jgi:hypothetical protein